MTKQENEERLARLKSIVLSMPEKPGSYQYYDENHTIIYVGKAKNLKRRVSSYFHKRHMEYKMSDIEKAVRKSFPKGVDSITKQELVTGIKKHFHCSAKEAHYNIGVARRKKLVDIAADFVTLL